MACNVDIATCPKLVYLLGNFILGLAGLTVMGFGAVVIAEINDFIELMPYNPKLIAGMSIAFGALAFCSSGVGFFGAFKEARLLLVGNVIFKFGLAAVKIWMTIVIFMNMDNLYMMVRIMLDSAIFSAQIPASFHLMEERFSCCGSTGSDSYFNRPVPASCCPSPSNGVCQPNMSYLGCNRLVADFFESYAVIIANIIVRVAALEVVTAISGIFLIVFIKIKSREKSSV